MRRIFSNGEKEVCMYIKKLIGTKCYLSPLNLEDAEQYAVWLNDVEVTDNLQLISSVITVDGERELLKKLAQEHNYGIIDIANNQLIGNVGFVDINHLHRTAEIGIFIGDKSYWSKGYGQEALSLLLDYAFKKLNLHTILLRVYDFNQRAIACYEKTGFRKIGEIRDGLIRNMEYHNVVLMDILPTDFYEKNPQYKTEK